MTVPDRGLLVVSTKSTLRSALKLLGPRMGLLEAAVLGAVFAASACSGDVTQEGAQALDDDRRMAERDEGQEGKSGPYAFSGDSSSEGSSLTSAAQGVGLAIEINNGSAVPLKVRAGQKFYINQLDLRASLDVTIDEGVAGLNNSGDFASLIWSGVQLEDTEPVLGGNADGTFTRRRFYRSAFWMELNSVFTVTQINAKGQSTSSSIFLRVGSDNSRSELDSFFVRRLRAIQWTYDCPSLQSCAGANDFEEEALVELRNSMDQSQTFEMKPSTTALKVQWSLKPSTSYIVPVEQVALPTYSYGVSLDITPLTHPALGTAYAPGQSIDFQLTLRDGAGKPLHTPGSLPTYNEVIFGTNEAGIQYYSAFFDPTATYWRRKHRERMLMTQIIGPAQNIQPIRSIVPLADFLGSEDVQHIGTLARDGVFSDFMTFPPSNDLFGGAYDPAHAGWDAPVSDTWSYAIPANAPSGTYLVTVKGRRVYLGEDIPFAKTIEIQVGSTQHTAANLGTGPCTSCHSGGGALNKVLHGTNNRDACNGCHAPLAFELEGPIYVRTHFIHSRSNRIDASVQKCSLCHVNAESIQRTSKSACLSCHKSYPASHVAQFGPIESEYVGGGAESFAQCTGACHTKHPKSGL